MSRRNHRPGPAPTPPKGVAVRPSGVQIPCPEDHPPPHEDPLPDERRTALPLKNGAEIEVGLGQAYLGVLEGLLENDRGLFDALLAAARGGAVGRESVAALKRGLLLRPDGTPLPGLSDVLLSAYQATAEGPVLVNPFRLGGRDEARLLERLDRESHEWLLRQIRRDDEHGRGR